MRGKAAGSLQNVSSALAWTKDQFSPIIASDADNTVSLWGPVRSRWADVKGNLAFFFFLAKTETSFGGESSNKDEEGHRRGSICR